MPEIRGVIFDLDGTLVDSAPDLQASANRLLGEMGYEPLDLATVTSFIGNGIPKLVERSLKTVGAPTRTPDLEAATSRFKAIYGEAPVAFSKLYPGVGDALAELSRQGLALGVCTNKSEQLAKAVVEGMGLGEQISALVGGDTLAQRKPDPEPIYECARRLECPPENCVYVGDSETDEATAVAAGLPFVLFTKGYRKTPVGELRFAAKFEEFVELSGALKSLGTVTV